MVITLFLTLLSSNTFGLKVVTLPMYGKSHTIIMEIVSRELQLRGHDVILVVEERDALENSQVPMARFNIDQPISFDKITKLINSKNGNAVIAYMIQVQKSYCSKTLNNTRIMQAIADADVVVSDLVYLCSYLLPEKIDKVNILLSPGAFMDLYIYGLLENPNPLAYIPQFGVQLTPQMSFYQRIVNCFAGILTKLIVHYYSTPAINELRQQFNISLNLSLRQLFLKPSLVLLNADFAIEFARPLLPNVRMIGPLTPQPPASLPQKLQLFMDKCHRRGVIYVSLGSLYQFRDDQLPALMDAFARLSHCILWKTAKEIDNLPYNVNIGKWLPQNDILGSQSVKAFVTHCGSNSMYEGAYHGVPMIGIPITNEQNTNMIRMIYAGIAVHVNYNDFNASDLVSAISQATNNDSFTRNVNKISRLLRNKPRTPRQSVVDWIEYIAEGKGANHLRVYQYSLSFWQLYFLDMACLIIVLLSVIYYCFRSSCCRGKSVKDKSD
ncbi:uncharacterized protein TRIADDRAFT_30812 [Trichoplax adhaerens]|uniref:UDP-glucuronosyltransferase n=1 Tax=Trichoplax adhaerens TaxID=10228 RepID=B3S845_TRIAD|nr:hypothetical protein TRIADDRAFT_30812 [Trichoplax adhaerens]EDV21133.1 hypothetical protein TRIADDRAFT_30812 [Trichoplax adhaerens]|eukprot:XP_002116463.1 hypothetical protein TRIADDRAFT_30812 [Trichoplax adhaerens]